MSLYLQSEFPDGGISKSTSPPCSAPVAKVSSRHPPPEVISATSNSLTPPHPFMSLSSVGRARVLLSKPSQRAPFSAYRKSRPASESKATTSTLTGTASAIRPTSYVPAKHSSPTRLIGPSSKRNNTISINPSLPRRIRSVRAATHPPKTQGFISLKINHIESSQVVLFG